MAYMRRPLRVGDRVRLSEAGPVRTVVRVTKCAAYIGGEPRAVEMPNGRRFLAHGEAEAISRNAFVFPE